jgi:glycosyltransferase involved in cell wall biosynthesis
MAHSTNINNTNTALIIPAYQPLPSLPGLVRSLLDAEWACPPIVVVNDGSDPLKKAIFDELSSLDGVTVIHHAVNLGKGAALRTAFNYLLVQYPALVGAITVDADGQHLPHDVVSVYKEFIQHQESLVLGSREFKKEVPLRSRFGNILTGHIFRLLVGKRLKDTQTGLRGIPSSLMRKLMQFKSNRYEFELDMLILCSREQRPIREVSISTVYEDGNKSSHFNPILDSFKIYFVFLRFVSLSLVTYATDLLIFTLSFWTYQHMFLSVLLGRASGLIVSATGSKFFVFKSSLPFQEVFFKFTLLWLTLLGISYSLMILFVDYWNFNIYASRIAVDSVLFTFNFLVQRHLIFVRKNWLGDGRKAEGGQT